ncbi:MAG: glutaredoxin 3 [Gammaproteobacteria bacterium]|nr:glutaredoxin 3 [Gammaproteobacteria bacterium]
MPAQITVYESALCGFCRAAKHLLDKKGWAYDSLVVDGNPELRRTMEERSGRHTVPQIWIGDQHVGGFDDLAELDADGELESLYEQQSQP